MALKNICKWAVISKSEATNNGVPWTYIDTIATFQNPFLAQKFIEKCLPLENRDAFEIIPI